MASKNNTDDPAFEHITTAEGLQDFCDRISGCKLLGFDTEFVSENRYRPQLCLLQVAADGEYAIVDTLAVPDISPFWKLLVEGDHITIVHAAREEFLFCYRACGKRPKHLFDVQLGAGMTGLEYPASYGNLVSKLLGSRVDKGETRTDWMRRPLSKRQIDYALSDVTFLEQLHDTVSSQLEQLDRTSWFEEEMDAWQTSLERTEDEPQWRRVSGISSLNRQALAIVRELWIARDAEAENKNRSPKRVLPDDLLVELAKRGTPDPDRLKAIRGFDNRVSKSLTGPISEAIQRALDLPESKHPKRMPRGKTMNLGLLGQFLTTALNVVCKTQNIAPNIVGTAQSVRTMAAWRLGMIEQSETPDLATGWRAEIVGQLIDRVLDGSVAISVGNPKSDQPLKLEYLDKK
ncbi:MAG: ribonuclease D [Mariniblastus sp.]|jgi:ribonuclease D